jgi:hypothetical protein
MPVRRLLDLTGWAGAQACWNVVVQESYTCFHLVEPPFSDRFYVANVRCEDRYRDALLHLLMFELLKLLNNSGRDSNHGRHSALYRYFQR